MMPGRHPHAAAGGLGSAVAPSLEAFGSSGCDGPVDMALVIPPDAGPGYHPSGTVRTRLRKLGETAVAASFSEGRTKSAKANELSATALRDRRSPRER
jgi:hypothetical protein